MNSDYKSFDIRNAAVAIVCAMVFGSIALVGAVGPAEAHAAPAAQVHQIAAQPHG